MSTTTISTTSTTAPVPTTTSSTLAGTMSTTTTTTPGVTTTTLATRLCAGEGAAAAICLLDRAVHEPVCNGAAIDKRLERFVSRHTTRAYELLGNAATARSTRKGNRLLRRAKGEVTIALAKVRNARAGKLTEVCREALSDLLQGARDAM